jgi:hypothetical protein
MIINTAMSGVGSVPKFDHSEILRRLEHTDLTAEEKAEVERLRAQHDIKPIPYTGGWRNVYADVCQKLGYQIGTHSNYFPVYKDGKNIGHIRVCREMDLVYDLFLLEKRYHLQQLKANDDRLLAITSHAVDREDERKHVQPRHAPTGMHRGMSMALGMAALGAALACGGSMMERRGKNSWALR